MGADLRVCCSVYGQSQGRNMHIIRTIACKERPRCGLPHADLANVPRVQALIRAARATVEDQKWNHVQYLGSTSTSRLPASAVSVAPAAGTGRCCNALGCTDRVPWSGAAAALWSALGTVRGGFLVVCAAAPSLACLLAAVPPPSSCGACKLCSTSPGAPWSNTQPPPGPMVQHNNLLYLASCLRVMLPLVGL